MRFTSKILGLANKYFNASTGTIYMLHRVSSFDNNKLWPNENLKVTAKFLENFIIANKLKFDFVSLDEAFYRISNPNNYKRKFIAITLDDGYEDNFSNAYPIFKKYNIPFAVYVCSQFIDSSLTPWWYVLEKIILLNNYIKLSNGIIIDCQTKKTKETTFFTIRNIILNLPAKQFHDNFKNLFSNYELSDYEVPSLFMSWNQIIELSKDPKCTIGAHTISHRKMSLLDKSDLIQEIFHCKEILEDKIGKDVLHFAYPFGTSSEINRTVVECVKKAGFKTSTVAYGGPVRKFGTDLFYLKREMFSEALNENAH